MKEQINKSIVLGERVTSSPRTSLYVKGLRFDRRASCREFPREKDGVRRGVRACRKFPTGRKEENGERTARQRESTRGSRRI